MNKEELEKRTLEFSVRLTKLIKQLPKNIVNQRIGGQLLDSGMSIGANYREANGAQSKKDFQHKIYISFKESREANYWLSILKVNNSVFQTEMDWLWNESDEFQKIFGAIVTTCRKNAPK